MRESGNGWTTVALLVVVKVLAADDTVAAEIKMRRVTDATSAPSRRIVVSIPDRKLAVVENDRVLRVFPVAVGAPNSPSPVGSFTIVTALERPTYYGTGKVIPPGPSNPLGTRWLGLDLKGYGIHGTDRPASIGHAQSHGCIRLRNGDVEQLFALVREGDRVELRGEHTPDLDTLFGGAASAPAAADAQDGGVANPR